ncbi:CRISPR-associated helicase Cas3' [Clostridium sp. D33t1_170424_F3]|uniref:CRISPR-associated helicase Cas3' n=1 Tax=Clostridium sp. D33t1_170424_F3 TaxID=2787099 RepID=UPI0018AA318C|nr:CRISPR-associated helicase Cas3' [Clostridium sp. D33t1_170424_F3]
MYIAHKNPDDGTEQSILQHQQGTVELAERFADRFGDGEYGRICAWLHDVGKYTEAFQKRIHGANIHVDHSTAGAQIVDKMIPGIGMWLAYCIAGHHGGLPNGGSPMDTQAEVTLSGRLKRHVEDYSAFYDDNTLPPLPQKQPFQPLYKAGFSISFFIRMLYSCLVDADYLDTETFMKGGCTGRAQNQAALEYLKDKLDQKLETFAGATKPIHIKRNEILQSCLGAAASDRGLFSLTVPTGGGKTWSSLAFALRHAIHNGMDRVIYVIPYTSIIEQNAGEFKSVLGKENVLEHHSNFDFDEDREDDVLKVQKLATENWDMPVIVTTNVQFFESLFACKSSRCRKLHNIANSVVIFDEAQMLPTEYLLPCVRAIAELVANYRCTAVLCSATQPALQPFFPPNMPIREICENTRELYDFFRRTRLVYRGAMDNQMLAEEMGQAQQALCIVDNRRQARDLYQLLEGEGCYHLSTLMYPAHRKRVIAEIKVRLKSEKPCKVVATRLIEAGVDVDFPVVYRAMAGLDSLVQAAGRCNREGKREVSDVFVFNPEEQYANRPHAQGRPLKAAQFVMRHYKDLLSPEAIHAYFTELYNVEGPEGLDMPQIVDKLESSLQEFGFFCDFSEIAEKFEFIDQKTKPVVIAKEDCVKQWVQELAKGPNRDLLRRLQPYAATTYPQEFDRLRDAGAITYVCGETAVLLDDERYSEKIGLDALASSGIGIII